METLKIIEAQPLEKCPYCGKIFKRVSTHITRMHKQTLVTVPIINGEATLPSTPGTITQLSHIIIDQHDNTSATGITGSVTALLRQIDTEEEKKKKEATKP